VSARRGVWGALIACALGTAGAARADVIHMLDGSEPIEGAIVSESAREVVIELERGRATIPRGAIDRIEKRPWKPAKAPATGSAGASSGASSTGASSSGAASPVTVGATPSTGSAGASSGAATGSAAVQGEGDLAADSRPLAEKLAAEMDPAVAQELEARLATFADEVVPGGALVAALGRARASATPSLARAAGRYGRAEGARAIIDLMTERERLEAQRAAKPTDTALAARCLALEILEPALVSGLGFSAEPLAAERLIDMAAGRATRQGREAAAAALPGCLRRVMMQSEDRAAARRILTSALAKLSGDALASLLGEVGGARDAETEAAVVEAAGRLRALPADARDRTAPLIAALASLQPALRDGEAPASPQVTDLFVALASDPDNDVRLTVVGALADSGSTAPAVLEALVDRFESDTVVPIQLLAHGGLVRANGGESLRDAGAWRSWARSGR